VKMNGRIFISPVNKPEHRLGTELSLIFAYCHKLRQSVDRPLSQTQARILSRIQQSAENIRDLRAEICDETEQRAQPIASIVGK